MRRAAKQDGNHAEIVKALRAFGVGVIDTSGVGNGFPDLLLGFRGRWMLMEVKDGRKPPSARKLTEDQIKWWDAHSHCGPVALVTDVEGAIRAVSQL